MIVIQLEVNPFCHQKELVEFCIAGAIAIISQDPLAKGVYQRNKVLKEVADSFQISIEEVCHTAFVFNLFLLFQLMFRWCATKGYVSLIPPNTQSLQYLSAQTLMEHLPDYVMEALDSLDTNETPLLTSWAPEGEEED